MGLQELRHLTETATMSNAAYARREAFRSRQWRRHSATTRDKNVGSTVAEAAPARPLDAGVNQPHLTNVWERGYLMWRS